MVHVVLAGGGTAGHTSPLIATAERLRELVPDVDLVVIGTPKGLESRVIPAAGLRLEQIPPVPLPRSLKPELFAVPGRLLASVREARRIIQNHRADVVVGFGGYVSLPAYLAARQQRVPIVVHEGNAVPGLANRIAARFTPHVAVSFPKTPLRHARYLGLPVRAGIARLDRAAARAAARAQFDLDPALPTLLVSGGSQGARSINLATEIALPDLLARGVQVLHVLGPKNFADAPEPQNDPATGARYRPVAYVAKMEDAYAAADLMLGRSGAGTVVETAVVGLPVVFVPLPHGNGEQARNADALVAAGASRLVPDSHLTGARLLAEVFPLVTDAPALAAMTAAGHDLVPSDAAGALAHLILDAAGR